MRGVNGPLLTEMSVVVQGIHFAVSYRRNMYADAAQVEDLIPVTACNSHKQAVQGELFARKAGLYTLLFDNSASRSEESIQSLKFEGLLLHTQASSTLDATREAKQTKTQKKPSKATVLYTLHARQ